MTATLKVMSALIALFAGILINCICGRAKLGAAVDVGSDHPEEYPCKMRGLH